MRKTVVDFYHPISYNLLFFNNLMGTKEWEEEYESVFDEYEVKYFIFDSFDAATEFAFIYLKQHAEFNSAAIELNVLSDYEECDILDAYPVWSCVVADKYTDSEANTFFKNVNIDNSKN